MRSSYTFAISLPRYAERFRHIATQLQHKIVDRYEILGVDGKAISLSEVVAPEMAQKMSPGQVGCALRIRQPTAGCRNSVCPTLLLLKTMQFCLAI
jgi:hypothetical protein